MHVLRATAIAACLLSPAIASAATTCHDKPGFYIDRDGQSIHRPVCVTGRLAGETAICNDGSHSFSTHRADTCRHRGGVAKWE